ncbi:hypothetical protein DFQ28_011509 [Apophysomyces sp. BC1034]|nr:hypothetical protein DFQ28_011509 [Apophysomyces sp. BC1034]
MKDMLFLLAKASPKRFQDISTCGFVIAGLKLNQLVMTIPEGYVCRISKLPEWLQYPDTPETFVKLITPIFNIVWHTKVLMKEVIEIVNEDDDIPTLSYVSQSGPCIPPCFTPYPIESKSKKRKAAASDLLPIE